MSKIFDDDDDDDDDDMNAPKDNSDKRIRSIQNEEGVCVPGR